MMANAPAHPSPAPPTECALTRREREVLAESAAGQPCKVIARRLGISVSTVRKHRASLLSKLGLANGVQLTVRALTNPPTRRVRAPPSTRP